MYQQYFSTARIKDSQLLNHVFIIVIELYCKVYYVYNEITVASCETGSLKRFLRARLINLQRIYQHVKNLYGKILQIIFQQWELSTKKLKKNDSGKNLRWNVSEDMTFKLQTVLYYVKIKTHDD